MPVRAVVFDAMGTVIEPSPSVASVYRTALKKHCGLDLTKDDIQASLKAALRARSSGRSLETSENEESAFWDRFIRELAGDAPGRQTCFDELLLHFGQSDNWRCFDDVAPTFRALSGPGLVTGIASNFDRRLHAVLNGMPAFKGVQHCIVSSEVGWRKPSPRFFDAMCQTLGMTAAEVLVVGDDLTNDVLGAQQFGCPAAWICRNHSEELTPAGAVRLSQLTELPDCISSGLST